MPDSLGDAICRGEPFVHVLLAVISFLVLLFLASLPTVEYGTPEYYISIANLVVLASTFALAVGYLYYCRRREET